MASLHVEPNIFVQKLSLKKIWQVKIPYIGFDIVKSTFWSDVLKHWTCFLTEPFRESSSTLATLCQKWLTTNRKKSAQNNSINPRKVNHKQAEKHELKKPTLFSAKSEPNLTQACTERISADYETEAGTCRMEITRIGDLSPGVRAHLVHRYEQTGSCVSDSERTLGKERCTSDSTLVLFKSPGRYNFTTADTHTRALFLSHTHSLTRTLTCTRTLTAPSISTRLHFAENLSIQEQI